MRIDDILEKEARKARNSFILCLAFEKEKV